MQAKSSNKAQAFLSSSAGTRFRKLIGMLGSNGAGEVSNAATMASKLLVEHGLTWSELLGAGAPNGHATFDHHREIANQRLEIAALGASLRALRIEVADKTKVIGDLAERLRKANAEAARLKREMEKKPGTVPPEQEGLRVDTKKFASKMQAILNWIIDQIEDAIELSAWEQSFLQSMRELKWKISPKQFEKLDDIAERAGVDLSKLAAEIG